MVHRLLYIKHLEKLHEVIKVEGLKEICVPDWTVTHLVLMQKMLTLIRM